MNDGVPFEERAAARAQHFANIAALFRRFPVDNHLHLLGRAGNPTVFEIHFSGTDLLISTNVVIHHSNPQHHVVE